MVTLKTTMRRKKTETNPALLHDYPTRLSELDAELRLHAARTVKARVLKSIEGPDEKMIGQEKVLAFEYKGKPFAVNRMDVTYAGSNHARGVRHIRFYVDGVMVLEAEGDFEDQQFGSNFRFQNLDRYDPGEWEKDFLAITNDLRQGAAKRRDAFKKRRDAANSRFSIPE
jgi:hypothetical protein